MKYLCKVCKKKCFAKTIEEIVKNRKLCDRHLSEENMFSLRKEDPKLKKKISVKRRI